MEASRNPQTDTQTVGAFEAKTHFSRLLAEVEHGAEFTITHRGRPVARLSPVLDLVVSEEERRRRYFDLLAKRRAARADRAPGPPVTAEEIREMLGRDDH